jgi:hypothetical protein
VSSDGAFPIQRRLYDFHRAGKQNEKGNRSFTRLEEYLAGFNAAYISEGADAFNL